MDCSQKASPPGANCIPFRRLGNGFCTPCEVALTPSPPPPHTSRSLLRSTVWLACWLRDGSPKGGADSASPGRGWPRPAPVKGASWRRHRASTIASPPCQARLSKKRPPTPASSPSRSRSSRRGHARPPTRLRHGVRTTSVPQDPSARHPW